jgi:hypothetical protein
MRLTTGDQETLVLPIVNQACEIAAKTYGLNPTDGLGHVLCTILCRLDRITDLRKPLEHYVRFTAYREAHRFFRGKRNWGGWQKED